MTTHSQKVTVETPRHHSGHCGHALGWQTPWERKLPGFQQPKVFRHFPKLPKSVSLWYLRTMWQESLNNSFAETTKTYQNNAYKCLPRPISQHSWHVRCLGVLVRKNISSYIVYETHVFSHILQDISTSCVLFDDEHNTVSTILETVKKKTNVGTLGFA